MATGSLVYVHGASDRQAQVDDQVQRIELGLRRARLPLTIVPARWGEEVGARLDDIELALPMLAGVADGSPVDSPSDSRSLRALLADGPLSELERLTRDAQRIGGAALGDGRRESDQLLEICRTEVGAPGELLPLATGEATPLGEACRVAAERVGSSAQYGAAHAAPVPETELVAAAGRAVAASVASDAARPLEMIATVQLRIAEAVVGAAAATLLAGYLGIDVGPGLKRWATDVLLPHRARLVRDAALGPADILLYQRDGAPMRAVVARALNQARARGGPVVALGNSLGGIILVDLLAESASPKPDLLVTVGSQAPLLHTFGGLRSGSADRPPFQPWLNIYDRRDLLGFVAGPVWPAEAGIVDREVDLGVGFPDAHGSTYLANDQVYRHILEHPALGSGSSEPDPGRQRFSVLIDPTSRLLLRLLFGVMEETAYVEINGELMARFGWFGMHTPLSNVRSWHIEGPWSRITAIGVRRSIRHGDVTFGGNHRGGVRLDFIERVRWLIFRTPALYVTPADLEGFAEALAARGSPGGDDRSTTDASAGAAGSTTAGAEKQELAD